MYLAPLNYDRFFKKVFSHTHIAKAFLEDLLDVKIEEITLLERQHLLTIDSAKIEVDFRCKIAGSKFRKWFDFAEKTRNKENKAADFASYKKEDVFKDIMRLILKKSLDVNDFSYIETEDEHIILVKRTLDGVREDALAEGLEKGIEKGIEIGREEGEEKALIKNVIRFHKKGKSDEEIADLLEILVKKVKEILENA